MMRPSLPRCLALLLLVPLAACDDEVLGPCERGAVECGVPGVDLAVTVAEIDWTGDQPWIDSLGAHRVGYGDRLHYRYEVVNRGSEPSEAALLLVGTLVRDSRSNLGMYDPFVGRYVGVPPLEPGESLRDRLTLLAPSGWPAGVAVPAHIGLRSNHDVPFWDQDLVNNGRVIEYRMPL